jgi:amino acid transporter
MTPANSDRDRPVTTNAGNPKFRRVLTLRDLIFYGIVLIQPIACVGIYGLVTRMSAGHAVTAILLAMFAMTLTAVSYGRMATVYPTSGSADAARLFHHPHRQCNLRIANDAPRLCCHPE